jgi:lambda family phage tail tape measure protein
MADVVGRGVIEVSADASKLKAGIDDAKRSIKSFGKDVSDSVGTASARASKSIDNYVRSLQTAAATNGKSTREVELYKLALRGASEAQLGAANNALRLNEAYEQGVVLGNQLKTSFIALASAAGTAAVAAAAGTIALIGQIGAYQDLAEKIGDTAVNVSSLKTASDVSGASMETIAAASVKLTAALSKTDDESKSVGAAIEALGLDFQKFKAQSPVEQLQSAARAFESFEDGAEKTAVAVSLFGKSGAELLGFLKEYAAEGTNAAYVTEQQVKAADDFSDANARLQSQIQQFLQVAAVNAIPVLNDIADLFKSIAKEQDGTSTATDITKGALNGLVAIFQALMVVGSDVIFVFKGVGNEIGAIAAQVAALAQLDFKGFSAIGDAVKDDAARARKELDAFQARVMAIGQAKPLQTGLGTRASEDRGFTPQRPRLNTSGLNQDKAKKGGGANTAAQEAKAQLAFDLDEIRKSQDALSNTIANGEKILEARRSASLISESDYYAQKRAFIQQNDQVQQAAAEKEIARLQAEKLAGKEKIDNDRKIADAQSKLSKLRENAATNLEVLAIKEKDSLDTIQRAYDDAAAAARGYLEVVQRAADAEIAGIGRGEKARGRQAQLSGIEEKFEAQRQALQRDNRNGKFAGREADYQRELALLNDSQAKEIAIYQAKYAKLDEMQKDWANGASEALQNYADEAANTAQLTQDAFTSAFGGLEDALTDFIATGKGDFKSLANSILADIARIAVKQSITGPLASALSGAMGGGGFGSLFGAAASGGGGGTDEIGALIAGLGARAIGGPVHAGGLYSVNEKGVGEMFEAGGKQYFMPANDGEIKQSANGGGGSAITVYYQAQPGESRKTAAQNGRALADQLAVAQRRNG